MEQRERGECDPPVTLTVPGFAHREVVRERHEADPWRTDTMLHGQRDGRDAPLFYGAADQPDGPVTQGSGRREQHRLHTILHQFARDLGGRLLYERGRVVDCSHEGEVARSQLSNQTILD